MKLKTIAAIFKRNKRLDIFNTVDGEQWISDGRAMYSMRGMPHMNAGIVLKIFDVPPDKHSDWLCNESEMLKAIDVSDYTKEETDIEHEKVIIDYFGDKYLLFPDKNRIYAINEDYIKPLLDEPEYLTFHRRPTARGGFVLAAKVGLELKAVIVPKQLHTDEKYIDSITRIANLYRTMVREIKDNEMDEFLESLKNNPNDPEPEQQQEKLL